MNQKVQSKVKRKLLETSIKPLNAKCSYLQRNKRNYLVSNESQLYEFLRPLNIQIKLHKSELWFELVNGGNFSTGNLWLAN